MKDYCIVVNTVSTSRDLWPMFFGQLERHYPGNKVYVFTDQSEGIPDSYEVILYDKKDNFRTQYMNSLRSVREDFVLYLNEDYVLYDDVNKAVIDEYLSILESDPDIACIRLTRGGNFSENKYKGRDDLFYLDNKAEHFFSQTATLWRRTVLQKIHDLGPDLHIAGKRTKLQFEVEANEVCARMNIAGLVAYHGDPKRGIVHYDSKVFPYIATALVKGKWNLSEYEKELMPLLIEYGIKYKKRGRF